MRFFGARNRVADSLLVIRCGIVRQLTDDRLEHFHSSFFNYSLHHFSAVHLVKLNLRSTFWHIEMLSIIELKKRVRRETFVLQHFIFALKLPLHIHFLSWIAHAALFAHHFCIVFVTSSWIDGSDFFLGDNSEVWFTPNGLCSY